LILAGKSESVRLAGARGEAAEVKRTNGRPEEEEEEEEEEET
jgi:hypothetical protein